MLPSLQSRAPNCSNEQKPKYWCPFLRFIWHVGFRRVNSWREHWWLWHWLMGHTLNAEILVGSCCLIGFPAVWAVPRNVFHRTQNFNVSENTEDVRNTYRNPNWPFSFLLKILQLVIHKVNFWAKNMGVLSQDLHVVYWRVQWCTELPGERESSVWLWLTLLATAFQLPQRFFRGWGR